MLMNKLSKQQNSVSTISTLANTNSKEISIYNAYITEKRLKDFSTKEDLIERVDEIKEAKENGTFDEIMRPWEDVKKDLEEKMRRNFIKENPPMDVPQEKSKENP